MFGIQIIKIKVNKKFVFRLYFTIFSVSQGVTRSTFFSTCLMVHWIFSVIFLGQTQQLSIFTKSNILWFRRKKGINLNHYESMITAHIHFQNEKKRHKVNLVVLLWKMAQNCIFWPNSKWKWCLMTQICINIEGEQFLMPSSNDYR